MSEEMFRRIANGYDPQQVDARLQELETQLAEVRERLIEEGLRATRLAGSAAAADHRRIRSDRADDPGEPDYRGVGRRVDELLRMAEEQAIDVVQSAIRDAELVLGRARAGDPRALAGPPASQLVREHDGRKRWWARRS